VKQKLIIFALIIVAVFFMFASIKKSMNFNVHYKGKVQKIVDKRIKALVKEEALKEKK